MTARNDVTGDALVSKTSTEAYRQGHDRIFCKHDWCSDGDPGLGEIMEFTCSRCGATKHGVPERIEK